MPIADRIRELRESKQWFQKELADKIGLSVETIKSWEQGRAVPDSLNRKKLTHIFGIHEAQLFTASPDIAKSVLSQLRYHPEDVTLLTESDWQTLRLVIEPLVGQMMRTHATTVKHQRRLINKYLFVIEDEHRECHLLVEMLHQKGYRVDYAFDGREALKRILSRREVPNLILLDMRMPKMDGRAFLQKLNKLKIHTKVIVITAYPQDTAELQLDNGLEIEGYVEKPFNLHTLLERIDQLVGA